MASLPADTVLRWSGHRLLPASDEPAGALLAADSWLVSDGAVRALDAHWARFGGWCEQLGVPAGDLARFRAAATAVLPRGPGRWFPRVEAVAGPGGAPPLLRMRMRPAATAGTTQPTTQATGSRSQSGSPATTRWTQSASSGMTRSTESVRVLVAAPGDPRTLPRWKGPDLERLIELRAQAAAAGADEVLLCDDEGRLIEGALSSLLWWEDDVLCTTPDEFTLPGITRALVLAIAGREGVAVAVRSPLPAELAGCETWLTSALHGIRVVGGWGATRSATATATASSGSSTGSSPGSPTPSGSRAALWRAALDRTARPLDAPDRDRDRDDRGDDRGDDAVDQG